MPDEGTNVAVRPKLLKYARELVPKLRERSRAAEEARKVSEQTISDLITTGLSRVCQPSRFGGSEQPWDVLCEISMELGKGCSSQAWVFNVFAEYSCLLAQFPEQAQQDVWGVDPKTLISGSYVPSGEAKKTKGGWLLNGRYGFSSGVHNSGWSIVGVLLPIGENDSHVHCFVLVSKLDRKIIDNWQVSGLSGTGSADIEFHEAFVPEHRVLDGRLAARGESPGSELNTAPVYKMPNFGFAQTALASVVIGAAKGAISDFTMLMKTEKVRGKPMADIHSMQLRLAEASAQAESARLLVLGTARENMAKLSTGAKLMLGDLARNRRNSAYGVDLSKRAVNSLLEVTGTAGLYLENDIQRAFRDINAASGYYPLSWDLNATIYGRYAVGLDLEGFL